jgi:flagellar basal body-associated protein FliL
MSKASWRARSPSAAPTTGTPLYFQAALTLSKTHDYERAAEVTARARDGELKNAILEYILRSRAEHLITRGRLDEAARIVERIKDPIDRTDVTVLLVTVARKKGACSGRGTCWKRRSNS